MNNRIISLVDTICQFMSFYAITGPSTVGVGELRTPTPTVACHNKGIVYRKEEKLVITFEFKFQ